MPLSRAEIQKRYREKKKAESGSFLKKDRERKRKAYIPTSLMSQSEAKKRRADTLVRVKRHIQKKKVTLQKMMDEETCQTRQSSTSKLNISLNFTKKGHKKGAKSNTALKEAFQSIQDLENQRSELIKERNRIKKQLERIKEKENKNKIEKKQTETHDHINPGAENLTPKSKADKDLRDAGVSPRKFRGIRKKLVFSNVLQEEARNSNIRKTCSMKTAMKYRCIRAFGKVLGVNRKTLTRVKKQDTNSKRLSIRNKVLAFLEREDNCVTLPGKRDNVGKDKKQKKILTDYLHNLHAKFCLENPEMKISRSSFSQMRPKHVLLVNFCSRNTCLCSRHQNIALKIKAIQEVAGTKNPDEFIAKYTDDEIQEKLTEIKKSEIIYTEWKRQDENGKLRWKQIQTSVTKEKFTDMLTQDVKEFREHVSRVKNQYGQMKRLRENLSEGEVLVWMDFAENFTCTALDEVQSAYWTSEQVTLHTTVVYFPQTHVKSHKSIVGISDLNIHNAGMVVAMISNLIPMLKAEYPLLKCVHYLTDSPTSQYRNKSIFEFLSRHHSLFQVDARWDFLEAGHGKGPCDGLGGSVKHSADMAVKQGKTVIQNAKDFYTWTQSQSDTSVSYYYVSQDMYDSSSASLQEKSDVIKAVPGTFKIHAVVPVGEHKIATRELSCNCINCLTDVLSSPCEGWKIHELLKSDKRGPKRKLSEIIEPEISSNENDSDLIKVESGDFCAALYDGEWYVGLVTGVNEKESKVNVNFMEEVGNIGDSFRWPTKRDEIWIPIADVVTKVPEPHPSGKRKRLFKLGKEIVDLIELLCERKL